MQKRSTATLVLSCAVMAVAMMTYVSAQRGGGQPQVPASERIRHLVYIGTPGDQGTDNQSGVIVLDADKNYSFVKRISYELPAAKMPGGKVSGIAASVPLQMLYITQDGSMTAFDLATDKIAWRFTGESTPVARPNGRGGSSLTGCCERPWVLPDGKTLIVGSHYNSWWYYIDGQTGKVLAKVDDSRSERRPQPDCDRRRQDGPSQLHVEPDNRQGRPRGSRRGEQENPAVHDLHRNGASADDEP